MYTVTKDYISGEGETFDKLNEAELAAEDIPGIVYIVLSFARDCIVEIKENRDNERMADGR